LGWRTHDLCAAHSQGVPPSRLRARATPWLPLGATPPSQRPRGPPRRRRTSHAACSAALRNCARPLTRATPATDEEVSGRCAHDLWRRAAHLRTRSERAPSGAHGGRMPTTSLLTHYSTACPCSAQFSEAHQKRNKARKKKRKKTFSRRRASRLLPNHRSGSRSRRRVETGARSD